jgi:hypothetical protein
MAKLGEEKGKNRSKKHERAKGELKSIEKQKGDRLI